ncbi:MAG: response regulator [Endomicrobiales bacterium]|nr:response regulator [Endomicrobiales bacterium]
MPDNKVKVLIIDDDPVVLEVTAAGLETDGFAVFTADDGKSGIEKVKSEKPDIILLDLKLPDINGFEVTKVLKQTAGVSEIPVIMITGDRTVDIDQAFAAGADDCIIKPIDMGYLVDRIRKTVKKKFRVLLVDDDRQIGDILKNVIIKQQFEAEVIYDGRKIFDVIKANRPDLILLDISLQIGPDGIELCRQLKSESSTKSIPIIMITANEYSDSVEKCFSYGAEDYIFKPFNLPDFILKIKKYMKMSEQLEKK